MLPHLGGTGVSDDPIVVSAGEKRRGGAGCVSGWVERRRRDDASVRKRALSGDRQSSTHLQRQHLQGAFSCKIHSLMKKDRLSFFIAESLVQLKAPCNSICSAAAVDQGLWCVLGGLQRYPKQLHDGSSIVLCRRSSRNTLDR